MKNSQSFALTLFLFSEQHQALLECSNENKKTKSVRILSFSFSRWPKSVRCEAAIRPEVLNRKTPDKTLFIRDFWFDKEPLKLKTVYSPAFICSSSEGYS
jgi:hypothetical protein